MSQRDRNSADYNYRPNHKANLSRGMKPHEVKSKSDIKKYCFDHGIPPPKFSTKHAGPFKGIIFIKGQDLTYNQHQAIMEMASCIGYRCDLKTLITQKS